MRKQIKYTDIQLEIAVKTSYSIAGVMKKLGMKKASGSYPYIRLRIKTAGLDISHFTGQGHLRGKSCPWVKKRPTESLLCLNGPLIGSGKLKQRLWTEGLLEKKCYECSQEQTWNEKPLVLQLDHIDGNKRNNKLENLRILCPNCHSQTATFTGKNIGKHAS